MPPVAALAAWLVIAGHGLVDSFLSFTTTYVTFAVAAGLALSPGLIASSEPGTRGASQLEPVCASRLTARR